MRTALGLSDATALADIDRQVATIESRLDIEDFKDPEKLSKFIDRFNNLWELKNGQSSQSVPTLLINSNPASGISSDLLMTLQNLKLGGI